jgi:hypothetical protein
MLDVFDDLQELGDQVLNEESTLLAPLLREKLLNPPEGKDESCHLRKSEHGKTG